LILPASVKKLLICTALSTTVVACGGGGGSDDGGTPPVTPPVTPSNNAPTITTFTSDINELAVTYSWVVADSDGDDLSCTLTYGNGNSAEIDDCKATTSVTETYQSGGTFTANLQVNDSSNDSANQDLAITVEALISLPEPVVTAGDNELVIFYNRADNEYTGWGLHLWANAECDAYAGPAIDWNTPQAKAGDDPNYGAYWVVSLKTDFADTDCVNYIMHKGDSKAPNDGDQKAVLSGERMIWLLDGINEIYTEATLFPAGVIIADTAAHWAAIDTVYWNTSASDVAKIRVYSSAVNDLGFNGETGIEGDNFIEFLPTANTANDLGMPRYSALDTFEATNPDSSKAKEMLTGKLLAIAYDSDDVVTAATYMQTPRVLDALYTVGNNDADEAALGLTYSNTEITASLWAPTAQQVSLQIYNADKALQSTETMTLDSATGVWSMSTPLTNDRLFYRYELTVYHPQNLQFETIWSTDPYSVSLSTNGLYSQFVNLTDADLKPMDWDSHTIPTIADIEDAVIYEGNIRDFSIRDDSTSEANRGKYLAFTEEMSVPVMHLQALVNAGLTHFQILPANDIASVDEDFSKQINLTNTVAQLCAIKSDAPVCGVESESDTLQAVFASYDSSTDQAKTLTEAIRDIDGYNFGYDPKHFNAPDGAFATDADGTSRILEMRSMIKALHDLGLRTSLDVVYNHTNSSGLWDNSVLDKVVPGYYYRRDLTTGNVFNETCCQDTETEHRMMDKLMADSLVLWAQEYKFDAFRFDIMGSHSKDSIINARNAVLAIDADTYFYGEGWGRSDQGYEQAAQYEMADSEVGTFNDRPRDIIRGASLFNDGASLTEQDIMRLGLAGTLQEYQLQDNSGNIKSGKDFSSKPAYAKDPADIINYVSKHDGSTLWDKLQYGLATDMTVDDRVRAQNIAIAMPILSQGIPFLQIGGDLLRSKSMDKNSYNNGDWYNLVDFTKTTNNWNVGLPLEIEDGQSVSDVTTIIANVETSVEASHIEFSGDVFQEFLAIRHSSKLFKLTTAQDIFDRVGFHNTGSGQIKGLIVMSIDDGTGLTDLDANHDAIVVVINGTDSEQSYTVDTATGFELHSVQQTSIDTVVQTASFVVGASDGTFTVPALTTAVFIKPQGVNQGAGLSAGVTRDAPDIAPFGNNTLYIRGSMNDNGNSGFADTETFTYDGNDIYSLDITLAAGLQTFTVTSIDSVAVDLGFSDVAIGSNSIAITDNAGSMDFTADAAGSYSFKLDASEATPVLSVTSVSPTVDCSLLVDSADMIPFNVAGDGELYVKGDHSGWNAEEAYRLHYKGNNTYQAVADFDGAMQFKLASSDGSWTTQLWAQADGSNAINGEDLVVGVSYPVAYNNAGTDNNKATLAAGTYSVKLTLNEADPAQGANVGSLIIQECQP
jgi:pullulanase